MDHSDAWSFLMAATNSTTALLFPLCCKRHILFPYNQEQNKKIKFATMIEHRKEIKLTIYRSKMYHKK